MKRIMIWLLTLLMVLGTTPVLAERVPAIREIPLTNTADYDMDGQEETATLDAHYDHAIGDYDFFTLTVGDQSFTIDHCVGLDPLLYAVNVQGNRFVGQNDKHFATMFMVSEMGYSEDYLTYCFLYESGTLYDLGDIGALATDMMLNEDGLITGYVRAQRLGTWYRPADFTLASGTTFDERKDAYITWYSLQEVPRDVYPMGMIVTLKRDLPLKASRSDKSYAFTIEKGQQVTLTACDDVCWVYVSICEKQNEQEYAGGWAHLNGTYPLNIEIKGKNINVDDVFEGILYAD